MERIDPIVFHGPRAYFTDFDYKIVKYKYNKESYRKEIERRLKILLLTKSIVVCAASHITHDFAYNLFKDNPILLTENMVLPALRNDKKHVTEYLEGKRIKGDKNVKIWEFYQENTNKVVDWELMENAGWLRNNILIELSNDKSIIRRNLIDVSDKNLDNLIRHLELNDIFSRELLIENISTWSLGDQKIILNFVNLIYHMSGARVVNCESVLPQENYIDYSLTDFARRRVMLSDTQIFSKLFFELAFETLHRNTFPIELLDILSFEDIYYLRKPLMNSMFHNRYDELIQSSTKIIQNSEHHLESLKYDIEKPLDLLAKLTETFNEVLAQELQEFQKKVHKEKTRELRKSAVSLGIGVAGFFPPVSTAANCLSLPSSTREFYINLNQWFRSIKEMNDYDLYLRNKEKILHDMIEKYPLSEKTLLLDALNLITDTISLKIKS